MNTFQKMIGISLLIASLSISYYFIIFMPQKEIFKLQLQKQEQINKQKIIPTSLTTSVPTLIPTTIPQPTIKIKNIKAECAKNIISKLTTVDTKGYTQQQVTFVMNAAYKKCLAENNISPEDLFTNSGQQINIEQNKNNNSMNCSSYKVGGYTYTNCY